MRKNIALFGVIIILVSAALAGIYMYFYKQDPVAVYDLVPANAVFVYESSNIPSVWQYSKQQKLYENLAETPGLKNFEKVINQLDTIFSENTTSEWLRNNPALISFHKAAKDDFGLVFYFPNNKGLGNLKLSDIIQQLSKAGFKHDTRTYHKQQLHEFSSSAFPSITVFIKDDFIVVSSISFLVEDIVRNLDSEKPSFFENKPALRQQKGIETDEGNLYLNLKETATLAGVFGNTTDKSSLWKNFGDVAYLDLRLREDALWLTGFSEVGSRDSSAFLSTLEPNPNASLSILPYLPSRTASVLHVYQDNLSEWHNSLQDAGHLQGTADKRKQLSQGGISINSFLNLLTGELAIARQESIQPNHPDVICMMATDANESAVNFLNALSLELAGNPSDSIYYESYGEQKIYQLAYKDFPAVLFGDTFAGFENLYFTSLDNFIIMANNVQVLKVMLSDIETENTWGKSVYQNNFFEQLNKEAAFTYVHNTARSWGYLKQQANSKWRSQLESNESVFKSFEQTALQFHKVGDKYYTQAFFKYAPLSASADKQIRLSKQFEVDMPSTAIVGGTVVTNHNNNRREVLVQDSLQSLLLISSDGNRIWNDSIAGKIRTPVKQIDYFKNGKLQYLFATATHLHLYDREGNVVEGFPVLLPPNFTPELLSVIDYDNTKAYRFLMADNNGNLYLFNKEGSTLEGWQPKSLGSALIAAPRHVRVRGKDYMIVLQKNGLLNVLNRRGEMYSGFPVDLKNKVRSDFFINIGATAEQSIFYIMVETGELISLNLNGKILERNQFYKPSSDTKFKLVSDERGQDFVILRQDYNKLSVLNRTGALKFEKDYVTSDKLNMKYYNFGLNNIIYSITDQQQEFSYFYNNSGDLLGGEPINSSYAPGIMYFESQNAYSIYATYQNKIMLYQLAY